MAGAGGLAAGGGAAVETNSEEMGGEQEQQPTLRRAPAACEPTPSLALSCWHTHALTLRPCVP